MSQAGKKNSGSSCAEVAGEAVLEKVGEVIGPEVGQAVRHDPPKSFAELTAGAVKDWRVAIIEAILVNIKDLRHLPSAKLLLELDLLLRKDGGAQPAEMQSFADLLVKSLEADMAAEARVAEAAVVE